MPETTALAPGKPAEPALALTRAQKAAVILCLLDREGAAPVFEKLDEEAIQRFVSVMTRLGKIDGATVRAVVAEFLAELSRNEQSVKGGARAALTMVGNYLGEAAAAKFSEGLDLDAEKDIWKRMSMVDPKVLAEFISREHPQASAVILSKLPAEHAGKVISELDPAQVQQIFMFFKRMKTLGSRSVEMIGTSIGNSLFAGRVNAATLTPAERVGAIMNYTASQVRDEVIAQIEQHDKEYSEDVKRNMFTFEDIEHRIARNEVSAIVRAVESETLVKALVGAEVSAPSTAKFILANISSRMAEMIGEEVKAAGKVKRKDSDTAQAEIIKIIRDLEAAGEITLIKDEEE